MAKVHEFSHYGAVMGVFSEWHPFVFRILNAIAPSGEVGPAYVIKFTAQAIAEWNARPEPEKSRDGEKSQGGTLLHSDFLTTWLAKHDQSPEKFKMSDIYYHAFPHVAAGAETTGISLTAVLYYLLRNPSVMEKLRLELDERWANGLPSQRISMSEAQECLYLQAVIKESLRIFPSTGLGMPRIVPKGGLVLAGRFFPEGVCLARILTKSTVAAPLGAKAPLMACFL